MENNKKIMVYVLVGIGFLIVIGLTFGIIRKEKLKITDEKIIEDFLAAEEEDGGFSEEKDGIDIYDAEIVSEKTTDDTNYLVVVLYGEKDTPHISYNIKLNMTYHLYKQGWILEDDYQLIELTSIPHEGPEDDDAVSYVKENLEKFLDAKRIESDSISAEGVLQYIELEENGDSQNYCQKQVSITVDYEYMTLQEVVCVNYVYRQYGQEGGGLYGNWVVDDIFVSGDKPITYKIKDSMNLIGNTFTDPSGDISPITVNSLSEDMMTANITYEGVTEDIEVRWSDYSQTWTIFKDWIQIEISPYYGVDIDW